MPGQTAAGDTITGVDERVLTEHSGTPDAGDTDTFPAVTADRGAAPDRTADRTAAPAATAVRRTGWYQVPYAIVRAGLIAGLAWAWQGTTHVRAGMVTVAAVLLAAALGRLVLPEQRAGMLVTRHRLLDVMTLLGLGVCILVMTLVLPRSV